MTYTRHRDTQETLAIIDKLDVDTAKVTEEELYKRFGMFDAFRDGSLSTFERLKPKVWCLFEEPYSSRAAKVHLLYCTVHAE